MKLLFTYLPFQLLLGVLIGVLYPADYECLLIVFLCLLVCVLGFYRYKRAYLFLFFIVCVGYVFSSFSVYITNDVHKEDHYTHFKTKKGNLRFTIVKQITSTAANHRFYANLHQINTKKCSGKILVTIPKLYVVQVGDVLVANAVLKEINHPISPYDFNYKHYLKRKQVYGKVYVKQYVKIRREETIPFQLQYLRTAVEQKVIKLALSSTTKSLLIAMLLGDKEYLTSETKTAFVNSGVVHLIAISGMHIGVLYLLFYYALSFLNILKSGKYIQVFLVLLLLIGFAIFSGLSSSVVRTVTMFGFILLAKLKRQKGLLLEPIVTSALVLLLCHPNYLLDAGFQLSYLAVISIVTFYPIVASRWKLKNKILKYFVDVLLVSVIAQLGVLGVSLYYFHQFSFQFLIANFYAVSLLPLVLYGGIVVLLKLVVWEQVAGVDYVYTLFIEQYVAVIRFLGEMDSFLWKQINFTQLQVFGYYILLFLIWYLFKNWNFKRGTFVLVWVMVLQLHSVYMRNVLHHKKELVVYNTYKSVMISVKKKDKLFVYNHFDERDLQMNGIRNNIKEQVLVSDEVFQFHQNTYLLLDDALDYSSLSTPNLVLILDDHPNVNLERVIKTLHPKRIIICANNYPNIVLKWKGTCKKLQVPFYDVKQQGAYVVSL